MTQKTTIEWTKETWNPVRGCTHVSPGCAFCYADVFAERLAKEYPLGAYKYGFELRLAPHKLTEPLRKQVGTSIFVNSMSDFFHEGIPDDYILDMCRVMKSANHHTFQVLRTCMKTTHFADLGEYGWSQIPQQPHG